ncbi:OstA-like protein [uncultured Mucilaginibacter sp.]|uniref:OstA-like protein n=1 Tax=uncultured Mucilaginibacter sp. TaxID=797541 RepID=UPI002600975A|nr:OstA-like protein [uncultured Mucilaginibacter sp.]
MNKYVLSFCLLLATGVAMGQKKSIVNLIKSQSSTGIKLNGKDIIKVYQGTFKQDFSTLSSDSAYFYPKDNAVDAFGNVHINQGDTLNIYSDKLNYNGNTKVAILTDNVRLVDKDATLTTNHLNYNTATRIGTYTDGGKLVNKDNTLLSKNGYYFAVSRDSYFRYDVSLKTPDALVKTDTMRYNTGTRISYFYGPTNIYSTKNEKDRDTLYTENGNYNTVNEQASFGKNNFYHSGTKSLKGDSLFYDKLKGYGRAVKHVIFNDREQKTTIRGNLGTYFKADERTIITDDPYVIMVTEQKDTTNADSAARADSLKKLQPQKKGAITMDQLIKKTIPGKTSSINSEQKNKLIDSALIKKDELIKRIQAENLSRTDSAFKKLSPQINALIPKKDIPAAVNTATALIKRVSTVKKLIAKSNTPKTKIVPSKKPGVVPVVKNAGKPAAADKLPLKKLTGKDTSKMKTDSIYMSADTIETQIMTYKDLKVYFEKQRLAHLIDTTIKKKAKVKESKFLTGARAVLKIDSNFLQREIFGKAKPVVIKKKQLTKKQLEQDSIAKKQQADSIATAKLHEPSDTARIRIIIAHHSFKMFKSDLQAKADSMFYSNSDSTIRCYVKPMMWTQGSQLSGDTIHLQMKHKKLDNLTMWPHAFIVNIEKTDSLHFNQVAGKRMRGFFKDDKLHRMLIEGNAESIYFARDSGKMTISGMQRSLSSKIRADFKDNKVTNMGFYTKPENKYGPLNKFTEDDKILKGFIWKPKDRPVSKESIIPSFGKKKKKAEAKAAAAKAVKGKPTDKKTGGKTAKDSTLKTVPGKLPAIKTAKDSTVKPPAIKAAKDSVVKKGPASLPVSGAGKDTTLKSR